MFRSHRNWCFTSVCKKLSTLYLTSQLAIAPPPPAALSSTSSSILLCSHLLQQQQQQQRRTSSSSSATSMSVNSNTITYLGQDQAIKIDEELMGPEMRFSVYQLMELAGLSVACAIQKEYGADNKKRVLVVCGPGNNGGDGLVAARHLNLFGFQSKILYPKPTNKDLYKDLIAQCKDCGIEIINNPDEILGSSGDGKKQLSDDFDLIVDAIFGFSFKGDIRAPFDSVIKRLKESRLPVVCVDIPSGWDVEKGNVSSMGFDDPAMLVSLTAPKLCAKLLPPGTAHYLGGRFISKSFAAKHNLNLPEFPGCEQVVKINNNNNNNSNTITPTI